MFSKILLLVSPIFVICSPSKNSTNGDIEPCLREFYQAAYDGVYNCTTQFDFFSKNSTPEVFKFAKSCFLEVAKPECSSSQYNLLSTKYDDFLKMITEEPKSVTSCESFYFKYNSMKCIPIMMDITHKVVPLAQKHLKVNDSRLVALVDSCDLVKACMSPLCFFNDIEKSMITEACNAIELRNTKFSECISEIQKESPDLSEYKCLKGVDFNSKEPTIQIDKFSKNKACTKQIMEDFCGKEAVENFDEYAEITAEKVVQVAQMMQFMQGKLQECISNCCQYPQHVQESNALYGKLYKLSNDDNWDCIDRAKKSSALNARTNFFGNHFPECDKNLDKCGAIEELLDSYFEKYDGQIPPEDVKENMTDLYKNIMECYEMIGCQEALESKMNFEVEFENWSIFNTGIKDCMAEFYGAIYEERYNCTNEFEWFSTDPSTKRDAYLNGKSCFFEVTSIECSNSSQNYLTTNYNKFVDLLTQKPDGPACEGLHYELNDLKCNQPISTLFTQTFSFFGKVMPMGEDKKSEYKEVYDFFEQDKTNKTITCMVLNDCFKTSCTFPKGMEQMIGTVCKELKKMDNVNEHFFECMKSILSQKLNGTVYSCIQKESGLDFFKDKDCAKEVMTGECPEEALVDFDNQWKWTSEIVNKKENKN
ncbi:hypothetical protein L5515_006380 [Caenorhabditis briggsae]|uniref:T20D4.11-like domain-containing protein n=1 Tax=Caenorhabditis briggsae TaxID=6238 RepID=A0AAE9F1F7_CAEBR|nr:hypothetical protein L5515_006380 [Caenorhabditis briggsae]